MKRVLLGFVVCFSIFCLWRVVFAQGKPSDSGIIVFDDARHIEYFKYETYLAAHSQPAQTPAKWAQLTAGEREKLVSDGEAYLNKVKKDLLAKLVLPEQEIELFAAVWGTAQASAETTDVKFNDPGYATYFKYLSYLSKYSNNVYTAETWQQLSAKERTQKASDGETFLNGLKTELSAKPSQTAKERELYAAVWGETKPAGQMTEKQAEAEHAQTESAVVSKLDTDLPKYQKSGNWSEFFDGNKTKGDVETVFAKTGTSNKNVAKLAPYAYTTQTPNAKKAISVPPLAKQTAPGEQPEKQSKTGMLIAGGVLVLGGLAYGAKKLLGKAKPAAPQIDEFDLDIRFTEQKLGTDCVNAKVKTWDNVPACATKSCVGEVCHSFGCGTAYGKTCEGTCDAHGGVCSLVCPQPDGNHA
ncbi:MAG: hypothetical protein WCS77_06425 [Elusimicrobiaceae bacterium]